MKCSSLALVSLRIDGHPKIEYAVLDRESQHTIIDSSLVEELGLRPWPTNTMLGSVRGSGRVSSMVEFEIQSAQNGNRCNLHALVIPNSISMNPCKYVDLTQYSHLTDLPLVTNQVSKPSILIGVDNTHLLVPYDTKVGNSKDGNEVMLFGEKTYLGWVLRESSTEQNHSYRALHNGASCTYSYLPASDFSGMKNEVGEQFNASSEAVISSFVSNQSIEGHANEKLSTITPVCDSNMESKSILTLFNSIQFNTCLFTQTYTKQ